MRHPKDGQKFLAEAIDALSGKIECKESDYSTENEEILSAIKSRSFDVVEYSVDEQDGETAHRFILKRHAPPDTLVAELIVTGERCQEYMFGKIVD